MAGLLQPRSNVDAKGLIGRLTFFTQFREKDRGNNVGSRRIQPNMVLAICVGIDGSVQPISLRIELKLSFIDCNVIWIGPNCRL